MRFTLAIIIFLLSWCLLAIPFAAILEAVGIDSLLVILASSIVASVLISKKVVSFI